MSEKQHSSSNTQRAYIRTKMYSPDNEKLISWLKKILLCAGFWDLPITNNRILSALFSAYSVFMRIGCLVFYLLLFTELIRLIAYGYDATTVMVSFSVVANVSKIMAKVVIYLKYDTLALFKDVIEKEKLVWDSNDEEIKTLYKHNIVKCKIYVLALALCTLTALGFLQLVGAAGMLQIKEHNKANNASVEPHLMYQSLLPFNKLDHLTCTFLIEVFMSWEGFTYNCTTHLVFTVLLVYAASQFQVLQVKLKNYVETDFSPDASREEIDEKIVVLKGLIREHQYLIGFVKHFNECTKTIIMVEFLMTSFDLASVSVSLVKLDASQLGFLLLFIITLLVQIYLIGWNSNEIKLQSEAIADAAYESRWYLLNKEAKQLTHIIIARAQIPVMMTIGPFGPMTTRSLLLVLKASYSYISILKE